MTDCFALLQLPQSILLDERTLKDQYHALAAVKNESEETINQAYGILKEPAKRIAHLLSLHQRPSPAGERPEAALFDLFFVINTVLNKSDAVISAIATANSALQRASQAAGLLTSLQELEDTIAQVNASEAQRSQNLEELNTRFPELADTEWKRLTEIGSDLVFLTKWKQEIGKRQTQVHEVMTGLIG